MLCRYIDVTTTNAPQLILPLNENNSRTVLVVMGKVELGARRVSVVDTRDPLEWTPWPLLGGVIRDENDAYDGR